MNLALTSNIVHDEPDESIDVDESVTEEVQSEVSEEKEESEYVYEPYIGQIEVKKINLFKGFYSKDSSLNNVKINLYLMPTSSYPDEDKGNVIIAGHSGNYSNSYFKDLYKNVKVKYLSSNVSLFLKILVK